jgi:hypothetical protein
MRKMLLLFFLTVLWPAITKADIVAQCPIDLQAKNESAGGSSVELATAIDKNGNLFPTSLKPGAYPIFLFAAFPEVSTTCNLNSSFGGGRAKLTWTIASSLSGVTITPGTGQEGDTLNLPGGAANTFGGITGDIRSETLSSAPDDHEKYTFNLNVLRPEDPPGDVQTPNPPLNAVDPNYSFTVVNPFSQALTLFGESLAFPDDTLLSDPLASALFAGSSVTISPNSSMTTSMSFDFTSASGDCDVFFAATGRLADGTPVETNLAEAGLEPSCGPASALATFAPIPEPTVLPIFGSVLFGIVVIRLMRHRYPPLGRRQPWVPCGCD